MPRGFSHSCNVAIRYTLLHIVDVPEGVVLLSLSLHGSEPTNVFRLCGTNDNSASFALGWVLERSPHYRKLVIEAIFGQALDIHDVAITLQAHGHDGGYTDVEIQAGRRYHAILEAKRSWELPTLGQLNRYVPRLITGGAHQQRLISLSAAHKDYAQRRLPSEVAGIPLSHISWSDLRRLAAKALKLSPRFEEKLWLRQLSEHLQEFTSMERNTTNSVFVVVLASKPMVKGAKHTYIDVVESDRSYFHPVGNHWPVQPVNYIGFRYRGRLQSVHHVDSFDIAEDVSSLNPKWVPTESDHFIYKLGPPMLPAVEMKTGNLYINSRVWCAIDTLLSGAFNTIEEARNETDRRNAEML